MQEMDLVVASGYNACRAIDVRICDIYVVTGNGPYNPEVLRVTNSARAWFADLFGRLW